MTAWLDKQLDRFGVWLVMQVLQLIAEAAKDARPLPPAQLPPLRESTIARAMELRRRDELAQQLIDVDALWGRAFRWRKPKELQ